ncbi:MAG TPA: SgcJ/EcaC family oxidoreductase [Bryobacteraceae bacterium]|jgi:uncharacterized protein (TIGR02246 family)|nr:SgcJ/EcaC family oxidoreductase [Bryobacteraceae bacterium]
MRAFWLVCIFGLILAGAGQSFAAESRAVRDLRDGEVASFVRDWAGRDADRIAAHFTDDGNLMIPNSPTMAGRASIARTMKNVVTDPAWSLALHPLQVEVSRGGDLGYARGTYILTAVDPGSKKTATEKGRFVTIFRKGADGKWKVVQQISNPESATLSE